MRFCASYVVRLYRAWFLVFHVDLCCSVCVFIKTSQKGEKGRMVMS